MPSDNELTVSQAAALTGYSKAWLRELCTARTIRATKFGRQWAIDRNSLQRYVDGNPVAGRPGKGKAK